MAERDVKRRPSAWSVGLLLGLGIALCETLLVAVMYHDLPLDGRARFLLLYGAGYAAGTALLAGALGSLAAFGRKRRPLAIALGVGAAWLMVIACRGYRVTTICSWTGEPDLPLLPVFGGSLAAAAGVAVIAYFLARSRWRRIRFALPSVGLLAAVGLLAFLSRPTAPRTPPGSFPHATTASAIASPIDGVATNILLISIDTLRADHTSPYGYARDTSPNMQALADRGVLFERCIAQRTNTAPAVASLMTGTYPPTHRVFNNEDGLQDFNVTLAEMLAYQGRVTAAINSNAVIGPHFNFQQGFSHFEMSALRIPGEELQESRLVNQAAFNWLESNRSRPFFLWIHYRDPHTPYLVPPEYKNLYTDDELSGALNHRQVAFGPDPHGYILPATAVDESHDLDFYVAQYDAEIKFVDDSLGELFAALEEWGLWSNTLVILTSDHGESMAERDYFFFHGYHCYENTCRVPLIFAHPSLPTGVRVTAPVSLVDLVPTLLELLSLPPAATVQGQSFAAALLGGAEPPVRRFHYVIGSYRNGYQAHAVTTERYKLIQDINEWWVYLDVAVEGLAGLWVGDGSLDRYRCRVVSRELYDLAMDPAETVNLAGRGLAVEGELIANLWAWQAATYRAGESRSVTTGEMTPEVIEHLRSLGYID